MPHSTSPRGQRTSLLLYASLSCSPPSLPIRRGQNIFSSCLFSLSRKLFCIGQFSYHLVIRSTTLCILLSNNAFPSFNALPSFFTLSGNFVTNSGAANV